MCRLLAYRIGTVGMAGGQAIDLESVGKRIDLAALQDMHRRKTGALIEWSACVGARLARADSTALRQYAQALGLAFQIADDIMDIEGDALKAGKRLQKDAAAGKATFVSLLGMDGAKARARTLVDEAGAALDGYGPEADTLRDAARFVISRES